MGLGSEIRDSGSGKKIYSGSRILGQKGTGSRIRSGKFMRIRRDPGPTTLIEANADLKHCRSICFHASPEL